MRLLPANIQYYGLDIAIGKPAPNLLERDILKAPIGFDGKKFDIVSAQGVFEYLGDFQLQKFSEIVCVLNPGGKLLVTYWNLEHRKPYVPDSFSHIQRLADFRGALEQYFSVERCFPASHNWQHSSPNKSLVRAANMRLNAHIPFISRKLAVEYFFICSPKA
jgi:SAM-dependent methyltransferase